MGDSRPRLLDLFCGAGGCTKGYQRAGFHVTGVDIEAQPNYCGDEFVQDNALAVLTCFEVIDRCFGPFDAIHASPPCQFKTAYKRRPDHVAESPNLIAPTRAMLERIGLPYAIENGEYACGHLRNPVMLCGSSFGLDVRRHRLFECSFPVLVPPCDHSWQTPRFPQATNRTNLWSTVEVGVWRIPLDVQQQAMEIDWMTLEELSEAIPPAYAEHVGSCLMAEVKVRQVA